MKNALLIDLGGTNVRHAFYINNALSKISKEKINANSTNKNLIRTPTQKCIYAAHPQQRLSYHLEQSVCI